MTKPSREKRIADINDKFRMSLVTRGRSYITAGVNAPLPLAFFVSAVRLIPLIVMTDSCGRPAIPSDLGL
jgi:hypothetical protein